MRYEVTMYVDTAEAAQILQCSPSSVARMRKAGQLPSAYTVEDSTRVLAYRYERAIVGAVALSRGLLPRCVRCGCWERTHPIQECPRGFLSNWECSR